MAGEVNVTIVGNLADDPELRYTQNGIAVVSVRVGSTPRTFNRTTNEWVDGDTVWVRCTAWREAAIESPWAGEKPAANNPADAWANPAETAVDEAPF